MPQIKKTSPQKASKTKQYSAPALSKGLDILELMANESGGLTLKEIASKLDRSTSEIFRMLVILRERSYVAVDFNSDRYILTLKLFELAHSHPKVKLLTSASIPIMRELAYELQQSCHLVIYNNGNGLVVGQQDSPADRGFSVRLGAETPLLESCSGHILMAYAEPTTLQNMLETLTKEGRRAITKPKLTKIKKRIESQGYELITSQQVQGVIDIGYPIFDYSGKLAGALVIPYLEHIDESNHTDIETARLALACSAGRISTALGGDL